MEQIPSQPIWKRVLKQILKDRHSYFFIAPALLLFLVFVFIPVGYSVLLAFQEFGIWGNEWVGLDNFRWVFQDDIFWLAAKNTLIYTLVMVPQNVLVALTLASLIQPLSNKAQTFFRAAYYLPGVTSAVVIAMVWRWLYDVNYGLLNYLLSLVNIAPLPWLVDPGIALGSIILMSFLAAPGAGIITYLAAMNGIPESYYEAARIDGAGRLAQWWQITVPLVKPTTLYLLIMNTIYSFQVFTQVWVMTQGGPGYSTMTLVTLIYDNFKRFDYGVASAQALVLFVIIMFFAVIQFRMSKSDVEFS